MIGLPLFALAPTGSFPVGGGVALASVALEIALALKHPAYDCFYIALAELDAGSRLLLHLGMTGQLFAAGARSPRLLSAERRATLSPERAQSFEPDQHTHLVMRFAEPGPNLYFRDVRKFGKVAWIARGEAHERLDKLGVDALRVKGVELHAAFRRRAAPIKSVLLDQSVLAGVGNIYADEALFRARVHPLREARRLTLAQWALLRDTVREALQEGIDANGATTDDFRDQNVSESEYRDRLKDPPPPL